MFRTIILDYFRSTNPRCTKGPARGKQSSLRAFLFMFAKLPNYCGDVVAGAVDDGGGVVAFGVGLVVEPAPVPVVLFEVPLP